MRLSDLVKIYNLHDSSLEDIHYFPDNHKLIIDLTLCNWRQSFYKEGEPEVVLGRLVFTGVSFYSLQSKHVNLGQNEILNAIVSNSTEDVNTEKLRITFIYININQKINEAENIEIEAEDVIWENL